MAENKHKYLKNTLIISICSFLSQILGLLRTTLLSSLYGATQSEGLSDCYAAAFKLPDIIYTLVVSGILSIVLIPYFITKIKSSDENDLTEINRSCAGFVNFFFLLISFCLVLGYIFAPQIVEKWLLTGWTDADKIALTVRMTRIIFIQVLFITLSGVFGSYLNALEKFAAYSFAMLSYNIGIIAGIVLLAPYIGIEGAAWGVAAGGFLHFVIQLCGSAKVGFRYSFVMPKPDRELGDLLLNAVPRIVTLGSTQAVRFFLVSIGSFIFSGAIFIFDNVENIAMVPSGLVAISISTTAFPIFIKYYQNNDYDGLFVSLFEKMRILFYFILPMSILLIILRHETVDILMGYKNFSAEDITYTSDALFWLMFSLPFFSCTLVLVKFYYAIRKSFLPMIIALLTAALAIGISYILAPKIQICGLAIGRGLGYIAQYILLVIFVFPIFRDRAKISPALTA
ncbi:MAG: murein biosynthesis integral membrane protein MurJ, partial [Spirochaetales bacterium]|nr:murein biosynthesis integral membrane protein MurJ [Spirochaetales bacterium]